LTRIVNNESELLNLSVMNGSDTVLRCDVTELFITDSPEAVADMDTQAEIAQSATRMEALHEVRILLPIESAAAPGGLPRRTATGTYAHLPPRLPWYLRVNEPRDVISCRSMATSTSTAGSCARHGADQKCNPTARWLDSPLIYRQDEPVMAQFRALVREFFSPAPAGTTTSAWQDNNREYCRETCA